MPPQAMTTKPVLRCAHCGREVFGTTHTRTTYHVDYYSLHTGDVEPVTIQRPEDAVPLITVLKLVRPTEVFTCVDCYRQTPIREQRDVLFRPELMTEPDEPIA